MLFKSSCLFLLFIGLFWTISGFSQAKEADLNYIESTEIKSTTSQYYIDWQGIKSIRYTELITKPHLSFKGANYSSNYQQLPVFSVRSKPIETHTGFKAILTNSVYEDFPDKIPATIEDLSYITGDIILETQIIYIKKKRSILTSFIPIRKNQATGQYQKLISFDIQLIPAPGFTATVPFPNLQYASNSILSSGTWHKISVVEDGVYQLSYSYLEGLGMNVMGLGTGKIRIYGNGGGMLPYSNAEHRHDDLIENAISIVDLNNNGVFEDGDYALFYGEGPDRWKYEESSGRFTHQQNLYSRRTCYFITLDGGLGAAKRISGQPSAVNPNTTSSSFDDYAFHESDLYNLLISGREWYGEKFDIATSYSFGFSFPNIISQAYIKVAVLGRALAPSSGSFSVLANGSTLPLNLNTGSVSGNYLDTYGNPQSDNAEFSTGGTINITINYNKVNTSSVGWLNYIELNARRSLSFYGSQMQFRDALSVGTGNITQFSLENTDNSTVIWETTSPANIRSQDIDLTNSSANFILETDSIREFIAFNGSSFLTPTSEGLIANQDIHGAIGQPDLVIISPPVFMGEASRLGAFREANDGLDVAVVSTTAVYNEFSSGVQDITAIKDLMRMLYNRANDSTEMPRYLLLFGDGSYDNLDRISDNTNYIPTYQSNNSHAPMFTYVSDDYFGLLDDIEGEGANEYLDIGVGRIPVQSVDAAKDIVDKLMHYSSPASFGNWRNTICFIADDEDGNIHINAADDFATTVSQLFSDCDIDKIYLDAYEQLSTPTGQRYPDAKEAINRRVEKGALIMNYTGHGGELGWAHEKVLENTDIKSWANLDNMPLFMTATCEFSRFDDPDRTASGEYVFLNPNGGGIGLLTTVRLVQSGANETLTEKFYETVFDPINSEMPRLGDIVMGTKNKTNNGVNARKYLLIGDPSMQLAYPKNVVVTDSINNNAVAGITDTISALSTVTVAGHLEDKSGQLISSFNGVIYPTVFDKAITISTLKNDANSNYKDFQLQKNALFRGKASVADGRFSFTFVVPKDISYQNGLGRISYYAENGDTDANGPYESFIIGGTSSNIEPDNIGPDIDLFLNDSNFVDGGLTDENPVLIAYLNDEHGINTTGNGIGHDIVAHLDDVSGNPIVLNDEYEADKDSYKSGSVSYQFSELSEGAHKLSLKVWDVYNNSSQAFTEFVVSKSANLALSHILNYPNPFTTYTEFWFEHNRPSENLDVQIKVFTISGRLIKTLGTTINTPGFRVDPKQYYDLQWNGLDDFGDKIGRGVYVYQLNISAEDGSTASEFQKLVILN